MDRQPPLRPAPGTSPAVGMAGGCVAQGGHRSPRRLPALRARLLHKPQLKALPSEYFMGSDGPAARPLPRAFARVYRKKQGEGERLARGRSPAGVQLRWARCRTRGQENGPRARGAGWDQGTAAAGGRFDRVHGAGEPLAPAHSPPQTLPQGSGWGDRWEGAAGSVILALCITPCLSFPSNAAEKVSSGWAGCTVRHTRSWWAVSLGQTPASQGTATVHLFPGVLAHPRVTSSNG